MIGKIKGKLTEVEGSVGLIETSSGVFYEVFLTPRLVTARLLPADIEAYTYLQVRDDALVLFGFESKNEYQVFKLLLSVSGVGPKTAFTVVSYAKISELVSAVRENNIDYFSQVPGLGKKTAMKIILELSQKMKEEFHMEKMYLSEDDKTVVDALVSLGYKAQEAKNILSKIPKDLSMEEKIKEGIRISTKTKR